MAFLSSASALVFQVQHPTAQLPVPPANYASIPEPVVRKYMPEGKCGDVFTQNGATPPRELEFLECVARDGQVVFTARYKVPGSQAATVEAWLHQKYGMNTLHFLCCGWEPIDGIRGSFESSFVISMYSDETLIQQRDRWGEVPFFYVDVELVDA